MADIASIANGSVGPVHKTTGPGRIQDQKSPEHTTQTEHPIRSDRVEVSRFASWMQSLRQMPETRTERVESVRSAIDAGHYETPEKIDQAIDGLLQDLQS